MVTLIELRDLTNDSVLRNRVESQLFISAYELLSGTPTPDQINWSASVLANPRIEGQKAFLSVLAANKTATVAQIQAALDTAIETNIDTVIPNLITAHAAASV
jgi:hypothetical protein